MRILKFAVALAFIIFAGRMAWTLGDGSGQVVFGLLAIAGIVCSRFIDPGEVVNLPRVWTEMGVLTLSAILLVVAGAPWYHRSPETEREFLLILAAVGGAAFIGGSVLVSAFRRAKSPDDAPSQPGPS